MDTPSDDHLQSFRLRSDQAFLAMQNSADKAMATFLQSYGEGAEMTSFQTPDFTWGRAPDGGGLSVAQPVREKVRQAVGRGKEAVEKASAKARAKIRAQGQSGHSSHEAFNDFGELGEGVKREFAEHANQAVEEGKGFLRSFTTDLGERAKREAAALAEAARKAVTEEKSLRGLRDRAQSELQAAKLRVSAELTDIKADTLADMEGIALEKIGLLHEEGMEAAGGAGRLAQKRLDDILLGAPSDIPLGRPPGET